MKNKIYHLSSCSTNKKILDQLPNKEKVELINIKDKNIDEQDLDYCAKEMGSYEALFSRKAVKYREWGLNTRDLSEKEIKEYILSEYTFLKRPVSIINSKVFAGNTKDMVEKLTEEMSNVD